MCHVFILVNEWLPPLRQLIEAGGRSLGIRYEKTKQGLVWLSRISVHTPLGERLLQLTSKAFQHAGWFTTSSLQLETSYFITNRTSFMVHFRKSILIESFYQLVTREATASKKSAGLGHSS